MKKVLFFAATAALALSSCSNEVTESFQTKAPERTPIVIETYMPKLTRAVEASVADLETVANGFWLKATANEELINTTFVGSIPQNAEAYVWGPSDGQTKFYWPADPEETVTFLGVYDPAGSYEGAETLSLNVDGANDYLVAKTVTSLQNNPTGSVSIRFKHILSEIKVEAVGLVDGYEYTVGKVKVNTPATATYNFAATENNLVAGAAADLVINDAEISTDQATYAEPNNNCFTLTTETPSAVANPVMLVPGVESTLTVQYLVYLPGSGVKEVKTATAKFTPVAASINTLRIKLNPGKVEIVLNVEGVDALGNAEDKEYIIPVV